MLDVPRLPVVGLASVEVLAEDAQVVVSGPREVPGESRIGEGPLGEAVPEVQGHVTPLGVLEQGAALLHEVTAAEELLLEGGDEGVVRGAVVGRDPESCHSCRQACGRDCRR